MKELDIVFIEFDNSIFMDIKEDIIIILYINDLLIIDYNKVVI